MSWLLAALLIPLRFTAPADTLAKDAGGHGGVSPDPVRAYVFRVLDANGVLKEVSGYADSLGRAVLQPHAPGTRERVWLASRRGNAIVTVFVLSLDRHGNLSAPSNGCVISVNSSQGRRAGQTALAVPMVRQARERCGQAALAMVLRYYGADSAAIHECESAYDPALHGSLITDLAGAARRAGYRASVATLTPDSVVRLLDDGVPPILLYQNGTGPLTVRHFGVVTGWDRTRSRFTIHDGSARPFVTTRGDLAKRWETAGSQALIVWRAEP
jgi:hypothetical protein